MPSSAFSGARMGLVAMLVAITILSQFFRVSNGVIGPEVMRELAMSPQALGFAGAAFFVALALMQIPVGLLFDRLGPWRTVAWLSLFTVAGALLNAAADSAGALFLARFITGVGCAASFMGAVLAGCLLVYLGVADSRPSRGNGSGRAEGC